MVIVGYYAHGNKHYVAFKDETDAEGQIYDYGRISRQTGYGKKPGKV